MKLKLMILTADPILAKEAEEAGIDRIFLDLEYVNKAERQKGRNTVISNNNIDDIPKVKNSIRTAELLVRVNPIYQYSEIEIDKAIEYGADILMLPMAFDQYDVKHFVEYVGGRTKTCIMIETSQAMARIDNILKVEGIDEIFIGLNDLHIGLGLSFMFEVLSGGLVEYIASKCKERNKIFGFGGIARIGDGILPAEKILGEHVRLGSQTVILSRTFKGEIDGLSQKIDLKEEVAKVRSSVNSIMQWTDIEFTQNKEEINSIVNKLVFK